MKTRNASWIVAVLLSVLLLSCVPPAPILTPSPIPILTPVPSLTNTQTPTPTSTATPVVTAIEIRSPIDGGSIDLKVTVDGTSQNIPAGSVVWVVFYLPATLRYYPAIKPVDLQSNGDWSSDIQIGGAKESGLKADIMALLADRSTQDALNAYLSAAVESNSYPGMEKLPESAIIFDRNSVTRR